LSAYCSSCKHRVNIPRSKCDCYRCVAQAKRLRRRKAKRSLKQRPELSKQIRLREGLSLTAMEFARRMGVTYETALKWLNRGIVPGALLKEKGRNKYWDIPEAALQMKRPYRVAGLKAGRN